MPNTYEPIATTTLSSAAASYTFSSIPQTYTDLVLVFNGSNALGNDAYLVQINGAAGTNYCAVYLESDGSTVYSSRWANRADIPVARGASATAGADMVTVNFLNYINTNIYKPFIARYNLASTTGNRTSLTIGTYKATTAITSILFKSSGSTMSIGSTLTLYGIKAA